MAILAANPWSLYGVFELCAPRSQCFLRLNPGAFNPEEAGGLVAKAETEGFELQTSRGPAYGEAERHHYRLSFDDAGYASALWGTLQPTLQGLRLGGRAPLGLNENIRIYKYTGGASDPGMA